MCDQALYDTQAQYNKEYANVYNKNWGTLLTFLNMEGEDEEMHTLVQKISKAEKEYDAKLISPLNQKISQTKRMAMHNRRASAESGGLPITTRFGHLFSADTQAHQKAREYLEIIKAKEKERNRPSKANFSLKPQQISRAGESILNQDENSILTSHMNGKYGDIDAKVHSFRVRKDEDPMKLLGKFMKTHREGPNANSEDFAHSLSKQSGATMQRAIHHAIYTDEMEGWANKNATNAYNRICKGYIQGGEVYTSTEYEKIDLPEEKVLRGSMDNKRLLKNPEQTVEKYKTGVWMTKRKLGDSTFISRKHQQFAANLFVSWDDDNSGVLNTKKLTKTMISLGVSPDSQFVHRLLQSINMHKAIKSPIKGGSGSPESPNLLGYGAPQAELRISPKEFLQMVRGDRATEQISRIMQKYTESTRNKSKSPIRRTGGEEKNRLISLVTKSMETTEKMTPSHSMQSSSSYLKIKKLEVMKERGGRNKMSNLPGGLDSIRNENWGITYIDDNSGNVIEIPLSNDQREVNLYLEQGNRESRLPNMVAINLKFDEHGAVGAQEVFYDPCTLLHGESHLSMNKHTSRGTMSSKKKITLATKRRSQNEDIDSKRHDIIRTFEKRIKISKLELRSGRDKPDKSKEETRTSYETNKSFVIGEKRGDKLRISRDRLNESDILGYPGVENNIVKKEQNKGVAKYRNANIKFNQGEAENFNIKEHINIVETWWKELSKGQRITETERIPLHKVSHFLVNKNIARNPEKVKNLLRIKGGANKEEVSFSQFRSLFCKGIFQTAIGNISQAVQRMAINNAVPNTLKLANYQRQLLFQGIDKTNPNHEHAKSILGALHKLRKDEERIALKKKSEIMTNSELTIGDKSHMSKRSSSGMQRSASDERTAELHKQPSRTAVPGGSSSLSIQHQNAIMQTQDTTTSVCSHYSRASQLFEMSKVSETIEEDAIAGAELMLPTFGHSKSPFYPTPTTHQDTYNAANRKNVPHASRLRGGKSGSPRGARFSHPRSNTTNLGQIGKNILKFHTNSPNVKYPRKYLEQSGEELEEDKSDLLKRYQEMVSTRPEVNELLVLKGHL